MKLHIHLFSVLAVFLITVSSMAPAQEKPLRWTPETLVEGFNTRSGPWCCFPGIHLWKA